MSSAEHALFSVVVPVHNSSDTLGACLDALMNQSDTNYEVIVVDDCSGDESYQIAQRSGFATLQLSTNKGQAVARNAGVRHAKGTVLLFVDADVVVPGDWVATYRRLLSQHSDVAMICGDYRSNLGDFPAAVYAFEELTYRRRTMPEVIDSCSTSNCAIWRTEFEAVGGFPEYYLRPDRSIAEQKAVATAEDSELAFLLCQKGKTIRWTTENSVDHYFRPTWMGYWTQQFSYARFITLSVFQFPEKLAQRGVYRGEPVIPQLVLVALALFCPLFALIFQFSWSTMLLLSAISTAALIGTHRGLIQHVHQKSSNSPLLTLLGVLFISRTFWLLGTCRGVLDGVVMKLAELVSSQPVNN